MRRIMLFMPYGSVGGMERLAYSMYRFYQSKGYFVLGVKIIGLEDDIIQFGLDEIVLSRKDFAAYTPFERIIFYRSIPSRLKKIIRENKIDYSISFGDMANCFLALTRTKEVKIGSLHALKSVEMTSDSWMNRAFKLAYKTIYRRFHKMVCITKDIEQDLLKNFAYPFYNLKVIYNPHDFERIALQSELDIETDSEKKLFRENKVILFLGRFSMQKAPWHLVNAFSTIEDKDFKLVFIGDGDGQVMKYVLEQIKEHGLENRVILLGRKNNPYPYIKNSAVLALTSLYEGLPNVIVEALALGTPVIASNCTNGIMEVMKFEKEEKNNENLVTESGIITPNFFEGSVALPSDFTVTEKEKAYGKALKYLIFHRSEFVESIKKNKKDLLSKFNLQTVCEDYLG